MQLHWSYSGFGSYFSSFLYLPMFLYQCREWKMKTNKVKSISQGFCFVWAFLVSYKMFMYQQCSGNPSAVMRTLIKLEYIKTALQMVITSSSDTTALCYMLECVIYLAAADPASVSLSHVISCHSLSAGSHFVSQRLTHVAPPLFSGLLLFHGLSSLCGEPFYVADWGIDPPLPPWLISVPLSNHVPCYPVSRQAAILCQAKKQLLKAPASACFTVYYWLFHSAVFPSYSE